MTYRNCIEILVEEKTDLSQTKNHYVIIEKVIVIERAQENLFHHNKVTQLIIDFYINEEMVKTIKFINKDKDAPQIILDPEELDHSLIYDFCKIENIEGEIFPHEKVILFFSPPIVAQK